MAMSPRIFVKNTFIDIEASEQEETPKSLPRVNSCPVLRPWEESTDEGSADIDTVTEPENSAFGEQLEQPRAQDRDVISPKDCPVRNTFIHIGGDGSLDDRIVQSMPHGMFGCCIAEQLIGCDRGAETFAPATTSATKASDQWNGDDAAACNIAKPAKATQQRQTPEQDSWAQAIENNCLWQPYVNTNNDPMEYANTNKHSLQSTFNWMHSMPVVNVNDSWFLSGSAQPPVPPSNTGSTQRAEASVFKKQWFSPDQAAKWTQYAEAAQLRACTQQKRQRPAATDSGNKQRYSSATSGWTHRNGNGPCSEELSRIAEADNACGKPNWLTQSNAQASSATDDWTTIMVCNIPNDYGRKDFLDLLEDLLKEQELQIDFVYLPIDWKKKANKGYAYVNLRSHEEAVRCTTALNGFAGWKFPSKKVCEVKKAKQQGLDQNIAFWRNQPIMHPDAPDDWKPVLFVDGQQSTFPAATQPITLDRGMKKALQQL